MSSALRLEGIHKSFGTNEVLRAHVQRRLDFALSGLGDRIASVVVRLSRPEPRRASTPSRCQLEVVLRPRNVRAEDTDADLFVAVDNAALRLSRSVARALERERAWQDGEPEPKRPATRRSR